MLYGTFQLLLFAPVIGGWYITLVHWHKILFIYVSIWNCAYFVYCNRKITYRKVFNNAPSGFLEFLISSPLAVDWLVLLNG